MRRSLRIKDRVSIGNSSRCCQFCDHTERCCTRNSIGPVNMFGEGDANMPSTSNGRIEDNIDPREFLPNFQDENFLGEPINLTIMSHCHFLKLMTLIISVTCASVIAVFVNPEYSNFLSRNKSVDVSLNKKTNVDVSYCYNFVNYYAQRLALVNRNLKFTTQKLEALYYNQLKMQQQTHDIQKKVGNLKMDMSSKIEEALNLHDADKVGIFDYALESAGGYIISTPETYGYSNFVSYDFLGIKITGKINRDSNPKLVIQPGNLPGECYAFKGQRGRIQIGLARLINIHAITIEHTSPHLVETINSAPKEFVFYGLNGEERHELGCFIYRIDKNQPLQTFPIIKNNVASNTYEFVEFNFLSNYGNPNYTCVYRVRVHGNSKMI